MLSRPDFTAKRLGHVIGGAGKLCRWVITCLTYWNSNLKETDLKAALWRESSESTNEIKQHLASSALVAKTALALVSESNDVTEQVHSRTLALNEDLDSLVGADGMRDSLHRAEQTIHKLVQLLSLKQQDITQLHRKAAVSEEIGRLYIYR